MKTLSKNSKIVFLSTFPPTHCGIATFTEDTINAINKIYGKSIISEVCEITISGEASASSTYHLPSKEKEAYVKVASQINSDPDVKLVHIQHEFGLFGGQYGDYILDFLKELKKPVAYTFHTVLPNPNPDLKAVVQLLCSYSKAIFVMTNKSKSILIEDYNILVDDISLVPHGTHLVDYETTEKAKKKFDFEDRIVLSTFGLLGEGKSIETGLRALPKIVEKFPNVLYLILGKTHPNTIINNVDVYRNSLEAIVAELNLENNVRFVNEYLEVNQLLDYLKATDVYLFTSKDPNQAVSGTFSYAMSCSCPIVASKIPHTMESLTSDVGILADIQNVEQFADATLKLLSDSSLRDAMSINAYAKTTKTSWENTAIKHINVYQKIAEGLSDIKISYPKIKMDHQKTMTTEMGMIQFSKISEPDLDSGYTLDDNARALITICKHYQLSGDRSDIPYMNTYLNFISRCQLENGTFINYVDKNNTVEDRNSNENLDDSNGRAIWALGYFLRLSGKTIPYDMTHKANSSLNLAMNCVSEMHSPRAIGFAIKGFYHAYNVVPTENLKNKIIFLSHKLQAMYEHTSSANWNWFEDKLTYANSILPEALLLSFLITGEERTKEIAVESMDFLISKMFIDGRFKIISNNGWHEKGAIPHNYGEQPIEASYMMHALDIFYRALGKSEYKKYLKKAFNWFLGDNHLNHIMYNPITGGCYDGLEKENVNLNQGAESTLCYLSARLLIETYTSRAKGNKLFKAKTDEHYHFSLSNLKESNTNDCKENILPVQLNKNYKMKSARSLIVIK